MASLWLVLFISIVGLDGKLYSAKAELNLMRAELSRIEPELASAQEELAITESELEIAEEELKTTREGLETTKEELAHLKISYDGLVTEHGYTIKDPTYKEMMSFIMEDKTDEKQYATSDTFTFAMDVCNNAEEKGIRCAVALIRYRRLDDAIVAFNTIDEGLIYIEPQSDELVEPEIGKRHIAGTILEILVIW